MSLIETLNCEFIGNHEENPSIYELRLIWESFRDDETSWITIAYNEDTKEWGIGQTNYDVDKEQIANSMFEYTDTVGSACHALTCRHYTELLGSYWDFYSDDIMQLYSEYCNDKEKFDKLIKKFIIDGQL